MLDICLVKIICHCIATRFDKPYLLLHEDDETQDISQDTQNSCQGCGQSSNPELPSLEQLRRLGMTSKVIILTSSVAMSGAVPHITRSCGEVLELVIIRLAEELWSLGLQITHTVINWSSDYKEVMIT